MANGLLALFLPVFFCAFIAFAVYVFADVADIVYLWLFRSLRRE